VISLKMGLLRA